MHLETTDEGAFSIEDVNGGSVVRTEAHRNPDTACETVPEGARCTKDCQCEGHSVCIPEVGDFVECHGGRCQRPCDSPNAPEGPVYASHLDCPTSQQCAERGALAAPTCGPIADLGCLTPGSRCGPGTRCAGVGTPECTWAIELNARVRHACDSGADCSEGLHCVEHASGERSCEVPCFSHRMACPPMHACSPTRWVCEWLGE